MLHLYLVKGEMYRYFTFFLLGLICKDTDGDPQQTWFQAQRNCSEIGKRLIIDTEEQHTYWTGRYRRISEWLKIIGCFKDSDIEDQAVMEAMFDYPSAGLCQEFCTQSGSHLFAIKSNRCICLTENFRGALKHPNQCNYVCNITEDSKFVAECGGDISFNVYRFEKKEFRPPSAECLALQCGNSKYLPEQCNTNLRPICQKLATLTATTWLDSLEKCKKSSYYLLGNLPLTNVSEACINRTNAGPRWIGIARQRYSGIDEGLVVKPEDETSFQKCQKCRNNECNFVSCFDSSGIDRVFCSKTSLSTITYPTNKKPYPSTTHSKTSTPRSNITRKNNTSTPQDIIKPIMHGIAGAHEHNTPVSTIVIPIALVLIISGATAVGVVIYIRRCRQNDQKSYNSEFQKKNSPTEDIDHCYNEIDKVPDNGYFVLKPRQTPSITDIDKSLEKESPYNETEEGEYDHLGNNMSRRKIKEDTYSHTSSAKDRGYSDYDVTNHKEYQDLENTYDHTNKYIEPDYGHSENSAGQNNYGYAESLNREFGKENCI